MKKAFFCNFILSLVVLLAVRSLAGGAEPKQQKEAKISGLEREQAQHIMDNVASDIRKHYYDPKFHGLDWDATVREYKHRIDNADTMNMALSHVAAALGKLDDSHTFFLPPPHAYRHDYGLQFQMIGEHCYVVRVKPKSDAESKGVKPGDEVLSMNGYTPDRSNFWKMTYVYNILRPQPELQLVLRDPAGSERNIDIVASIKTLAHVQDLSSEAVWDTLREEEDQEHFMRARYVERGDDLFILKFPGFTFSQPEVDDILGRVRKHRALIVDLRGNPGGHEETLKYLLGGLFEHDVKIADRVGREIKQETLMTRHASNPFQGKIVVLVDSHSASAAELFARVIQLEKRGTVIGDLSSGSVMEALHYPYKIGQDIFFLCGVSITHADLIMSDGKSLEHTGVTPDEVVVPTAADMAAGRDPVLAHAAEILGVKISSEDAAKMFPYEWTPE